MFRNQKTGEITRAAIDETRAIERAKALNITDIHMIAVALTRIADTLDQINFQLDERKDDQK